MYDVFIFFGISKEVDMFVWIGRIFVGSFFVCYVFEFFRKIVLG